MNDESEGVAEEVEKAEGSGGLLDDGSMDAIWDSFVLTRGVALGLRDMLSATVRSLASAEAHEGEEKEAHVRALTLALMAKLVVADVLFDPCRAPRLDPEGCITTIGMEVVSACLTILDLSLRPNGNSARPPVSFSKAPQSSGRRDDLSAETAAYLLTKFLRASSYDFALSRHSSEGGEALSKRRLAVSALVDLMPKMFDYELSARAAQSKGERHRFILLQLLIDVHISSLRFSGDVESHCESIANTIVAPILRILESALASTHHATEDDLESTSFAITFTLIRRFISAFSCFLIPAPAAAAWTKPGRHRPSLALSPRHQLPTASLLNHISSIFASSLHSLWEVYGSRLLSTQGCSAALPWIECGFRLFVAAELVRGLELTKGLLSLVGVAVDEESETRADDWSKLVARLPILPPDSFETTASGATEAMARTGPCIAFAARGWFYFIGTWALGHKRSGRTLTATAAMNLIRSIVENIHRLALVQSDVSGWECGWDDHVARDGAVSGGAVASLWKDDRVSVALGLQGVLALTPRSCLARIIERLDTVIPRGGGDVGAADRCATLAVVVARCLVRLVHADAGKETAVHTGRVLMAAAGQLERLSATVLRPSGGHGDGHACIHIRAIASTLFEGYEAADAIARAHKKTKGKGKNSGRGGDGDGGGGLSGGEEANSGDGSGAWARDPGTQWTGACLKIMARLAHCSAPAAFEMGGLTAAGDLAIWDHTRDMREVEGKHDSRVGKKQRPVLSDLVAVMTLLGKVVQQHNANVSGSLGLVAALVRLSISKVTEVEASGSNEQKQQQGAVGVAVGAGMEVPGPGVVGGGGGSASINRGNDGDESEDGGCGLLVSQLMRATANALGAAAQSHDMRKHAHLLVAAAVDVLAKRPPTAATQEALGRGLFALLDKCSPQQKKQLFSALDGQGRVLFEELHTTYIRDFKFVGKS